MRVVPWARRAVALPTRPYPMIPIVKAIKVSSCADIKGSYLNALAKTLNGFGCELKSTCLAGHRPQ